MRTKEQEYEWENQYQVFKTWLNTQALPAGADKDLILFNAWDNACDVEIGEMASCAIGTVITFIDQKHEYPYLFNFNDGV
jgi:hypothetical protein